MQQCVKSPRQVEDLMADFGFKSEKLGQLDNERNNFGVLEYYVLPVYNWCLEATVWGEC